MVPDIILRKSAFGGFNKHDVLECFKALRLAEQDAKTELEQLKTKENELSLQAQEALSKANELESENEKLRTKIEELQAQHKAEIENLKAEYEKKIEEATSNNQGAEERVGAAMIDVRRYADLLLKETCDKIDTMSEDADKATAATLSRVLDISSGIQAFSDKLNSVINDILSENESICKELTSFKGSLKIPYEQASGKLIADVLED